MSLLLSIHKTTLHHLLWENQTNFMLKFDDNEKDQILSMLITQYQEGLI